MTEELAVILALILLAMSKKTLPWGTGWSWPIPQLEMSGAMLLPAISQEYRGGGASPHYGLDLMYGRPGAYFVPAGAVPVLAARAGALWSVHRTARGWGVVIDHGAPWATYYQHLESVVPELESAPRGTPIAAGQPLGVMGSDPLDGGHVRHLHFAVWYQGHGDAASVDPADAMSGWVRPLYRLPDAEV